MGWGTVAGGPAIQDRTDRIEDSRIDMFRNPKHVSKVRIIVHRGVLDVSKVLFSPPAGKPSETLSPSNLAPAALILAYSCHLPVNPFHDTAQSLPLAIVVHRGCNEGKRIL